MPHRAPRARACAAMAAVCWLSASRAVTASPIVESLAAQSPGIPTTSAHGTPDPAAAAVQAGAEQGWWDEAQRALREREYGFCPVASGFEAPNRALNLRLHVTTTEVRATPRLASSHAWSWTWRTESWGRDGAAQVVTARLPRSAGPSVAFDTAEFSERYDNRREGLEQTFILHARPAGSGVLVVEGALDVSGLTAAAIGGGVEFRDDAGATALRYTALRAWDATGRALPAHTEFAAGHVRLVADDSDAVYPVTLDPVLTTASWSVAGDQNTSYFGWQVATAGDVNGDGFSDVIVGAYLYDNGETDEGAAFLYLGSVTGLSTTPAWEGEGNQATCEYGTAVATAGDINGDGYDDVIVGAPLYDNPETDEGEAFVYLGSATGLAATPAWTTQGDLVQAEYGYSVATAGDVNGDGFADVVIGAQYYTHNGFSFEGRVLVYLGGPGGLATTPVWSAEGGQTNAYFGCSVACAGDINGDGLSDIIIGAWRYTINQGAEGAAFVYLGGVAGPLTDFSWRTTGNAANASFGISVSSAGDINGDGYADVIVGAQRYESGQRNEGRVFVYTGSAAGLGINPLWVYDGNLTEARMGYCVASAGDVNGDGFGDIIVGAYGWHDPESYEGSAAIFFGSLSGPAPVAAWRVESDQINARMGWSVATAGDVNGDGYSDVVVGTPNGSFNGGIVNGQATLYMGSPAGPSALPGIPLERDQAGAHFSAVIAAAGDVNGDGYQDLLVGAPQWDNGNTDEGAAFLYLGSSTGLSTLPAWSAEGEQDSASFGAALAGGHDVNGDGFCDVVVGAPGFDADSTDAGEAQLFLGSLVGLSPVPVWTALGDQQGALLGTAVSVIGDINGDGYADIAAGAPGENAAAVRDGRVFVYLGTPDGAATLAAWTADGGADSIGFGSGLAGLCDANGDGYSDLVAGAPRDNAAFAQAGAARLYLGGLSGLQGAPAWIAQGAEAGAQLGGILSAAGDVNGDGLSDLAAGTPLASAGGILRGAAYLYLGDPMGLQPAADWFVSGGADSSRVGASLAAGDINGDGYADLVVGSPGYAFGEPHEGRVLAFFGGASSLADTSAWDAQSNLTGAELGDACALADVNGDGYADVDAGAPFASNGQNAEGRMSQFGGNGGPGLPRLLRQARSTDLAPLAAGGTSDRGDGARLQLAGRTAAGRGRAWVELEVKPVLTPFDGTGLVSTAPQQTTHPDSSGGLGSVVLVNQLMTGLAPLTSYHWRARTRSTWPTYPRTPWLVYGSNGAGVTGFRTNLASSARGSGEAPDAPRAFALRLSVTPTRGPLHVSYTLPASSAVDAALFDVRGRQIATLAHGMQAAGERTLTWDARTAHGERAPAGVYILRLRVGATTQQIPFVVTH